MPGQLFRHHYSYGNIPCSHRKSAGPDDEADLLRFQADVWQSAYAAESHVRKVTPRLRAVLDQDRQTGQEAVAASGDGHADSHSGGANQYLYILRRYRPLGG